MTAEQFLPTRWILSIPARATVAAHLRRLRANHGRTLAAQCRNEMIRIGCFPVRWRNPDGSWHTSEGNGNG